MKAYMVEYWFQMEDDDGVFEGVQLIIADSIISARQQFNQVIFDMQIKAKIEIKEFGIDIVEEVE